MNTNNVILTKKGNIDSDTVKKLEAKGFIVVVCKDPKGVSFIDEFQIKSSNVLSEAALKAVQQWGSDTCKSFFLKHLTESLYPNK